MEGMMDDPSIVKGKRTKRQRLHLPSPPTTAAAAASSSSSTSAELSDSTTEEEEDMANCLILLAQGAQKPDPTTKLTSRRFAEAATTTSGKAGFFVYECKTCGKCFPSFQALGGHRASHKKPKLNSIPPATASSPADESEAKQAVMGEDSIQLTMNSFALQAAGKSRTHECSICGAEFSSGQALGGHMRRHRQVSLQEPGKKEGLSLDLNLPAPPEDDGGDLVLNSASPVSAAKTPPFSFASKTPILLFDVCAS